MDGEGVRMRRRWLPERWSAEIDKLTRSKLAHRVFWIGILFKAIDGLLEIAGGVLLLTVSSQAITSFAFVLLEPELAEDPNDWLANHLLLWIFHLSTDSRVFAIAYLLVHGIDGYIVIPLVERKAVRIPPALTIAVQLAMYWMAGVLGMLIADPLAASALFLVRHFYVEPHENA